MASGRPLIGITCSHDTQTPTERYYLYMNYVHAVVEAGGTPVLLPAVADETAARGMLEHISGLLLSGGDDLDPYFFHEEPRPELGEIHPDRDAFELFLAREALAGGMPVLGICRGCQVLCVAGGGTLYQDINSQVPGALKHQQKAPGWHPTHDVRLEAPSRLAGIMGTLELRVNSFHHQAIREAGTDFRVVARAADGIVEAIEGHNKIAGFALGIQWHPERMWSHNREFLKIFAALVKEAVVYGR
ncbi:MAG: gamma-glutamyl-gamma-aminobutyrate hydrolase family protein [Syntrophothermus sp.]